MLHFRFSNSILRRLGEELNPNPDQGIIELVKNSYDADARVCRIELHNTDEPGGVIRIVDDGVGMTMEDVRDKWLVLGESDKAVSKPTSLGRLPAGSKGLGRLAALRLGSSAQLVTRPLVEPSTEYFLRIDWSAFERARVVEDVGLELLRRPTSKKHGNGSEIKVYDLRMRIGRVDVKRLARSLLLLADPFGDDPDGFQPILVAPEFNDLEEIVKRRHFEDADYHLIARLDSNGKGSAQVVDWLGRELFSADHEELTTKQEGRAYSSPPVSFDLWVFIMSRDTFVHKRSSIGDVRAWLQSFGGVHIYHNGIRVNPYGNPGNDWLEMNLRRAQIAEERPSTNTSIGRIAVTDVEGRLKQKTDRSGFIEADEFLELKRFAQDSLEWMGRRRLEAALRRRAQDQIVSSRSSRQSRAGVERAIEKAPASMRAELLTAFSAYERSREREVQSLRKEVQLYRTLSTAGIMAATFAHESIGNPLKAITTSISTVERRAKRELHEKYDNSLKRPVDSIKEAAAALSVLGTATLKILDHSKRRAGRVDVNRVILRFLDTFGPFFTGRDVRVVPLLHSSSPYLRGTEAALESILANLLNNALVALERASSRDRLIEVKTEVEDSTVSIRVLDNGPGIVGISKRDIWLPGETTQPNGTGLGLTIVRDTVRDLGGDVDALEHGGLGGAEIIVRIPIIGV
jgi:C4-dicarboxylate-specific signal transduction histidine kinase